MVLTQKIIWGPFICGIFLEKIYGRLNGNGHNIAIKIDQRYILLRSRHFFPYETMTKIPCSVSTGSWKISKSLLVAMSKVTMKLRIAQI